MNNECAPGPVSINALARDTHTKWLASGDRRYSPFNKPWPELLPEARAQISRQARNAIDMIRAAGHCIPFIDEYAAAGPGDVRWDDPEKLTPRPAWRAYITPEEVMGRPRDIDIPSPPV